MFERVYADDVLPKPVIVESVPWPEITREKLESIVAEKAQEHGIREVVLKNLVTYESQWDVDAEGDGGCSHGLVQLNLCAHKNIAKAQAIDPEFALEYAASEVAAGREHKWSVCNCFTIVNNNVDYPLPKMRDIQPNSEPIVNGVAIFYYKDKDTGETVKHVAHITKLEEAGFWVFEGNFEPCKVGSRFIEYGDPHYAGTYFPG